MEDNIYEFLFDNNILGVEYKFASTCLSRRWN